MDDLAADPREEPRLGARLAEGRRDDEDGALLARLGAVLGVARALLPRLRDGAALERLRGGAERALFLDGAERAPSRLGADRALRREGVGRALPLDGADLSLPLDGVARALPREGVDLVPLLEGAARLPLRDGAAVRAPPLRRLDGRAREALAVRVLPRTASDGRPLAAVRRAGEAPLRDKRARLVVSARPLGTARAVFRDEALGVAVATLPARDVWGDSLKPVAGRDREEPRYPKRVALPEPDRLATTDRPTRPP